MTARLRLWVLAGVLGLFAPAVGIADHGCLLKKPCAAPPAKIVVEMSPPEVTFAPAPATCVKAPAKTCAPQMRCFPFTLPSAPAVYAPPPAYAPAYAAAPVYAPAYAAAPVYAPAPAASYAPVAPAFAPSPVPHAAPCGSAAYSPFPQAAPACGVSGFGGLGPHSGLGMHGLGTSASELRAMADDVEAQEKVVLQRQLAFIERQYGVTATRAAAAGLRPNLGLAPTTSATGTPTPAAGTAPTPRRADNDELLKQLNELKAKIDTLSNIVITHHDVLEKNKFLPLSPGKE